MGKSLENPGSVAIRSGMEASPSRSEPVVEFTRKKSAAGQESNSLDDAAECELTQLRFGNCLQVELPRNAGMPLVTVTDSYTVAAMEAYKSLRTRLLKAQANRGIRSVVVTSVGRSEGKTLTAFNLACCCSQVENLPVLLIDGDLRSRSLTKLVGDPPSAGLADVMSGTAPYENAIVRTDVPNLYVMGAGMSKVPSTELFSSGRWNQIVSWSRDHFRLVLVDALSMGALADFELVVVRARSTSREELKVAIEQLDSNKLVGVVWNAGHSKNGRHSYS
jgi:Mrp family chromosome partitioning ATPase